MLRGTFLRRRNRLESAHFREGWSRLGIMGAGYAVATFASVRVRYAVVDRATLRRSAAPIGG